MAIGDRLLARRGTEAERQQAIAAGTILEGEINFTTDEEKLYIGEAEVTGKLQDDPVGFPSKIQVALAVGAPDIETIPPFSWKPGLLEFESRFNRGTGLQSGTFAWTIDLNRTDDVTRPPSNGIGATGEQPYFDVWGRAFGAVQIEPPMRDVTLADVVAEAASIKTAVQSIQTNGLRGGTF